MTTTERFWSKVVVNECGCWLWTAARNADGYGLVSVAGKLVKAHRWSYQFFGGAIPSGFQLDHVRSRGCIHRHCVNPAHLEPVTPLENTMRGDGPASINARKARCVEGHDLTGPNLYVRPNGKRQCRECGRAQWRAYHARRLAS